jgi:sulfite exporter TauE/SafE
LSLFSSLGKKLANLWGSISLMIANRKTSWAVRQIQLGLVWGLVPCGLIYSALSLAFLSGSAWHGALILFSMGLGTIPNLMIISGGLGTINRWLAHVGFNPQTKIITAILLIISALWGISCLLSCLNRC